MNEWESQAIAIVATQATLATAAANAIEIPQPLADAIRACAEATGERISKVTLRRTARAYRPAGPLPAGMGSYQWQMLAPRRRKVAKSATFQNVLPGVRAIEPQPCYELHVPGDPVRVAAYLCERGFEAFSAAPFRCSVRLRSQAHDPPT